MSTPATLAAYERIVAAPPQEGFELFALALRAAADQERARVRGLLANELCGVRSAIKIARMMHWDNWLIKLWGSANAIAQIGKKVRQ